MLIVVQLDERSADTACGMHGWWDSTACSATRRSFDFRGSLGTDQAISRCFPGPRSRQHDIRCTDYYMVECSRVTRCNRKQGRCEQIYTVLAVKTYLTSRSGNPLDTCSLLTFKLSLQAMILFEAEDTTHVSKWRSRDVRGRDA